MTAEPLDSVQNKMIKPIPVHVQTFFFNHHIPENTRQALTSFPIINKCFLTQNCHLESHAVGFPVKPQKIMSRQKLTILQNVLKE